MAENNMEVSFNREVGRIYMEKYPMESQSVFLRLELWTVLILTIVLLGCGTLCTAEQIQPPDNTVLLDFYGPQCPPCRAMRPVIEQLKQAGYPVRSVNIAEEPILAQKYGITNIPCFIMISDGRVVSRTVGMTSANSLATICQNGIDNAYAVQQEKKTSNQKFEGQTYAQTVPVQTVPVSGQMNMVMDSQNTPENNPVLQKNIEKDSSISNSTNLLAPDRLLASTVRIRVKTSVCDHGTGTIIDSRNNRALILTCGHLFREFAKGREGKIEVDMFGEFPLQNVEAKYICHDAESDLALICIPISHPVAIIPVAPLDYQALRGNAVASVGCDNGRFPTVQPSQIVGINKYTGPANIHASGASVQGRSGGGLFSKDGYLIGVTLANVPGENQALYSSYPAIHQLLNKYQLSSVITAPRNDSLKLAQEEMVSMPKTMPKPEIALQLTAERRQEFNVVQNNSVNGNSTTKVVDEFQSVPVVNQSIQSNSELQPSGVPKNDSVSTQPFFIRTKATAWPPRF